MQAEHAFTHAYKMEMLGQSAIHPHGLSGHVQTPAGVIYISHQLKPQDSYS